MRCPNQLLRNGAARSRPAPDSAGQHKHGAAGQVQVDGRLLGGLAGHGAQHQRGGAAQHHAHNVLQPGGRRPTLRVSLPAAWPPPPPAAGQRAACSTDTEQQGPLPHSPTHVAGGGGGLDGAGAQPAHHLHRLGRQQPRVQAAVPDGVEQLREGGEGGGGEWRPTPAQCRPCLCSCPLQPGTQPSSRAPAWKCSLPKASACTCCSGAPARAAPNTRRSKPGQGACGAAGAAAFGSPR